MLVAILFVSLGMNFVLLAVIGRQRQLLRAWERSFEDTRPYRALD